MLKAFLMDAKGKKYKNWDDLVFYCKYSANPVGRFVIDLIYQKKHLQQKNLEEIYVASDCLCTSLQIINHLQDCKKDVHVCQKYTYRTDRQLLRYQITQLRD